MFGINRNQTISTLGPEGTDSQSVATLISDNVFLFNTFEEAMDYAHNNNTFALVSCGYIKRDNNIVIDTWVDLNFRYNQKMEIVHCFNLPTKPMCIASRDDRSDIKSIALHPATEMFSISFPDDVKKCYVESKPDGIQLLLSGEVDACICSVDVVLRYLNLHIINQFLPEMVWVLYRNIDTRG